MTGSLDDVRSQAHGLQVADLEGTVTTAGVLLLVLLVVLRVASRRGSGSCDGPSRLRLGLAGGVAVLATLGSLWFSEGAHFRPVSSAGTSASPCIPWR